MKKAFYFAALIAITCITACNNPSTETTNAPAASTPTENTAKDNNAAPANQPEGLALMTKSDCSACHNESQKVVGPSFKDIAAKYPNTPENVARLTDEVIKGSSGIWGQVPMTPHTTTPKADVEKMVGYILALGDKK